MTRRLSTVTVQNIAMLIDIYKNFPQDPDATTLTQPRRNRSRLARSDFVRGEELPIASSKPFFDLLDTTLSDELDAADRPPVLDRYGRQLQFRRYPHQARRRGHARAGAAQPDLRVKLADLPAVDGRHLAGAADRRDSIPAQPDQADPAPVGGGREFRQGTAAAARFPPARRARGAPGGASPSSRCATASSAMSSSAPSCWPA